MFGTPNEIVKSYFGSASHVFLAYRLSQWYTGSKLGLFLALDTYIKLKVYFICMTWRHTMTQYCGQKRKDNTSSHGVRAYPWILSKKYWSVCPCICLCVCPHGITVGVSIAWIYLKFLLDIYWFFCCLPHISIPPVVSFFTYARFFPVLNSYICTIRLHTHDFFPSTEFLRMYNKTNYSKIE